MSDVFAKRVEALKEEFSSCGSWEDRYKKVIDLGKKLPELAEEHKIEKNKVKGCQSQVWLVASLDEGKIQLSADSDAVIVKGLIALLLEVYSGLKPDEVLGSSPEFLADLGFKENLSPSRTNGLFSMVKQIQYFALASKAMG